MLCEKCQTREAVVHVTEIVAESKEMKKHNFCEACFGESHLSKIVENSQTTGWRIGSPPPIRPKDESGR
jgi:protein-arginine kinase activator protein McsA